MMSNSNQARSAVAYDLSDLEQDAETETGGSPAPPLDEHEALTTPVKVREADADTGAPAPPGPQEVRSSTGNHVVVTIGIDRYTAWPHLSNAVNDARAISEVFRHVGFSEAHSLINENANGDAIRKLVTDDLGTLGVDDRLVIFFAGHGTTTTRVLQDGTTVKTGYIIPADAHNKQGQVATWIRLDSWLDDIARLPANHILVILDACHSGIALAALVKWRDVNTWRHDSADELTRRRSRRLIVSALDDQLALDGGPAVGHSLFTGCFLQALTGELAGGGRQAVTGTELAIHLQRRIREYPNSRQTPDFGAFALDDRGELMIPLFPLRLESRASRPPPVDLDVNAALQHRLASTLGELVSGRAAIAQLVAAHAAMLRIDPLPATTASTIWMYVLVELTNRGLFTEMSAIVQAARRRSRQSRRIDWSMFSAVLRPQTGPAVASWSHLTLDLRCNSPDADLADSMLITDDDTLLEAACTLHWRGVQPSDPRIEVTSYQLFGRTMPLLHEATLQPSHSPGTASWLAKIPVPYARFRTRRVTVRCADTQLQERRYVVPRAGSICAAIVWFAFAAFALYWLSPITPLLLTAPLTVFGVLSGLWSIFGARLMRASNKKRSFQSVFFVWELAVLFAALATALVIVMPPRLVVLVTNTTDKEVRLEGERSIRPHTSGQLASANMKGWVPEPPFCRCGAPGCAECNQPLQRNGVIHVVIGCTAHRCDALVTEYKDGASKATIVVPIDARRTKLREVTFEPGATSSSMSLRASGIDIGMRDVRQAPGLTMTLSILPDVRSLPPEESKTYSIAFGNEGALECDDSGSRIRHLAFDHAQDRLDKIGIAAGTLHSTWTFGSSSGHVRACVDQNTRSPRELTFEIAGRSLRCKGDAITHVIALEVKPRSRSFRFKVGGVESTWSSATDSAVVRACLGPPGIIELETLRPGAQVVLPEDLASSEIAIRRKPDSARYVYMRCDGGHTVQAVRRGTHRDALNLNATTDVICGAPP